MKADEELLQKELTDQIIKAFYRVYNGLGKGFLEKVYENALALELRGMGFDVKQQQPVKVYYNGVSVGEYYADLIVAEKVILELKVVETLQLAHEAQLLNYLRATELEIGLLLNFGPTPQLRRKVFLNDRKPARKNPRQSV